MKTDSKIFTEVIDNLKHEYSVVGTSEKYSSHLFVAGAKEGYHIEVLDNKEGVTVYAYFEDSVEEYPLFEKVYKTSKGVLSRIDKLIETLE